MDEFQYLHLNEYRPKWQDATQAHDDCRFHEPENHTEGGINNNEHKYWLGLIIYMSTK